MKLNIDLIQALTWLLIISEQIDMSQKDEKNDTSKERVDSNDISEQALEEAYNEFRRKHINASFMPKDMAKFMWLAGRDSVTTDKMIQNPTNVSNKQRLGEYRAGHYSSEMIAAMVNEAFLRVRASREFKLPSEEEMIDKFTEISGIELPLSVPEFAEWLIKALNEVKNE